MYVVELTAHHVRVPLKRAVKHASHARTETDNVIVRAVLADGTAGYGEGVPREYVTGSGIADTLALLKATDWKAQLDRCGSFDQAAHAAERLATVPTPGDDRGIAGNPARCAVELALLDAYGRHFKQPVSAVVELLAPDLYRPQPQVRYSGVVTSAKGLKLRLLAWGYRWYRFRQVKVKVGIPGYDDAHRLRILRSRMGPRAEFRVDANEAWQPAAAVEQITAMKPAGVVSVEQPLPHELAHELPLVRKEAGVPVMLDESLCGPVDAERAAAGGWCDSFNLRLSKCGGFIPTLRLAQFARQHNLGFQLGCQVGETAVLSAAGRHFAANVFGMAAAEGSYDRHLVKTPLSARDLTFGRGGIAPALPGPGLGFDLDDAALARITVRKEALVG